LDWKFDHLVHFTLRPEEAKESFAGLGFQAIEGGRHEEWGTYNCLCYFRDLRYIEWIGFADRERAESSGNPLIRQIVKDAKDGEGFSQIAIRTRDIKETEEILKSRGLQPVGPFPGSRRGKDGRPLTWSMLFVRDEKEDDCRYPFFIQWGADEREREAGLGKFMIHGGAKPSLSVIGYAAERPENALRKFVRLFGTDAGAASGQDEYGRYLALPAGGVELRFYEISGKGGRPFFCEIRGTGQSRVARVKNGTYRLVSGVSL